MTAREAVRRVMRFLYPPNEMAIEDCGRFDVTDNREYFGRMNDPTSAGAIKGLCGDSMEFYLVIKNDVVEDIKYYTDGCGNTRNCGEAIARRAQGATITEALSINAAQLIESGECEPEAGRHCAILAVSTLYRAIADYLLKA